MKLPETRLEVRAEPLREQLRTLARLEKRVSDMQGRGSVKQKNCGQHDDSVFSKLNSSSCRRLILSGFVFGFLLKSMLT